MKKTTRYRDRDRELEIKMTPMIDIVFLLLVFFVWTASFRMVEESLPTTLSAELGRSQQSAISPEMDYDQVIIGVTGGQKAVTTLNSTEIASMNDLLNRLKMIARVKNDLEVIIHPEDNVSMGKVIDVFDLAQMAGFDKVRFATPSGTQPGK